MRRGQGEKRCDTNVEGVQHVACSSSLVNIQSAPLNNKVFLSCFALYPCEPTARARLAGKKIISHSSSSSFNVLVSYTVLLR